MAKVLGIIAEYNPLHNGHLYHIKESKKRGSADTVVAVISGNFTQRGEPSIIDKWEKTKMAIMNGIDLVIELPTVYSISSAENFANGAINILNELGIIDGIAFGVENDNLEELNDIVDILLQEPKEYKNILKEEVGKGVSFPVARMNSVVKYLVYNKQIENENNNIYNNLLEGSNNILAIEYLKALKRLNSNIAPILIKREKVNYNDKEIKADFASATAIRNLLKENRIDEIKNVVPKETINILKQNIDNGTIIKSINDFSKEIIYKLRTMNLDEIQNLPEVTEGLENLIRKSAINTNSVVELIDSIKSKRYTQTRIQRILLYALLGIKKADIDLSKNLVPYIRVLGFNDNGKKLISKITNKEKVITSLKKFETSNLDNDIYKRFLKIDKLASDIYTLEYTNSPFAGLDYTKGLITL